MGLALLSSVSRQAGDVGGAPLQAAGAEPPRVRQQVLALRADPVPLAFTMDDVRYGYGSAETLAEPLVPAAPESSRTASSARCDVGPKPPAHAAVSS